MSYLLGCEARTGVGQPEGRPLGRTTPPHYTREIGHAWVLVHREILCVYDPVHNRYYTANYYAGACEAVAWRIFTSRKAMRELVSGRYGPQADDPLAAEIGADLPPPRLRRGATNPVRTKTSPRVARVFKLEIKTKRTRPTLQR